MTDYDEVLRITRRLAELAGAIPAGGQVSGGTVELVGPKGYIHGWIYVGTGTHKAGELKVGSYVGDHGRIRKITAIRPSQSWPPSGAHKDYDYQHIDPQTGRETGHTGTATMHDFEEVQHIQPDETMARNIKNGFTIREAQAAQAHLPEGEDLGGASAATIRQAVRDKAQADAVARHERYGPPRPRPGTGIQPRPGLGPRPVSQIRAELRASQQAHAERQLAIARRNAAGKGWEPFLPKGVTLDTASQSQITAAARKAGQAAQKAVDENWTPEMQRAAIAAGRARAGPRRGRPKA